MRVRHTLQMTVAADEDEKELLHQTGTEVILEGFTEHVSGSAALAAAGVLTVDFGALSACRGFMVKATGEFELSINGGDAITVTPGDVNADDSTVADECKVFMEAEVTSLEVTAGASDITVTWLLWGDAVP